MATRRYGKLPARIAAVHLRLAAYLDLTTLPPVPDTFGHQALVSDWRMYANDRVGDCVWAGAAHETVMWNAEVDTAVEFTDETVLGDYSALTGYDPADPDSDRGTDMQKAAAYRQKTGLLDAAGRRHRVGAYVAITPGNPTELAAACYLFGTVGVGLRMPEFAEEQFEQGKPWSTRGRYGTATIVGGHYVPVVGRTGGADGVFDVVTWGRLQRMETGFYRRWCDEALVYLSLEMLRADVSPEGFDLARLRADLQAFVRP